MRRVLVVLLIVVLVNLPWAHQLWVRHQLASAGREVHAALIDHRDVSGRYFVRFRLPRSVDQRSRSWTSRLDEAHYDRAVAAGTVRVRVVPGHPQENRPDGEVGSGVYAVIAIVGDVVLVLIGLIAWLRRRRWAVRRVVAVGPGPDGEGQVVTFRVGDLTLTAVALDTTATEGESLPGWLALEATSDVTAGSAFGTLTQTEGATTRAAGRLTSVAPDRVGLRMDDGLELPVLLGDHVNRCGIREPAVVTGRLTVRARAPRAARRT